MEMRKAKAVKFPGFNELPSTDISEGTELIWLTGLEKATLQKPTRVQEKGRQTTSLLWLQRCFAGLESRPHLTSSFHCFPQQRATEVVLRFQWQKSNLLKSRPFCLKPRIWLLWMDTAMLHLFSILWALFSFSVPQEIPLSSRIFREVHVAF